MTRTFRRTIAASALAVLSALGAATAASAAPQTFVDPGGSGASVTLSTANVYPGQRLLISGAGFVGTEPAGPGGTPPAGGVPLVAIKPYDIDLDWTWGGANAYNGSDDAKIWFAPDAVEGRWSGYIDIPTTLTQDGVLPGESKGQNWLRILSGAFSTGGSGPFTGNVSTPITYKVPFTVSDRVSLGLTSPSGALFQAGTRFRSNASVTPRAHDFPAAQPITATLDGTPVNVTELAGTPAAPVPASTTADGGFPTSARPAIPAGTSPGAHTLAFTVAGESATVAITVTAPPTARLVTTAVRPGGLLGVAGTGFVGVAGAGQKVAVVVNEAVLACLTASTDGAISGTARVPDTLAAGTVVVGFNVGTSCKGPTGPQDDLPAARVVQNLTVSPTAPAAAATGDGVIGGALPVTGSGFPAGAAVSATIDGQAAGSLTADGAGNLSGSVTVPGSTVAGEHVITLTSDATAAVALFNAVAPVPAPRVDPPVVQQPPVTPPVVVPRPTSPAAKSAKLKGNTLTLTLATKPVQGTKLLVTSTKKLRTTAKGKAKIVTLAKLTVGKSGKLALKLTADGKRLVKRYRSIKVAIQVTAPGATPSTKKVTLRL